MDEIILKFLKTGDLDRLSIGMTIHQVCKELDVSFEEFYKATNTKRVYEEKGLMLCCFKGKLDIISVTIEKGTVNLPSTLAHRKNRISFQSYDEVVAIMRANQVVMNPYERETHSEWVCYQTPAGVSAYFVDSALVKLVILGN